MPNRFSVIENGLNLAEPAPPRQLPPGGRRARFGYFGQLTAFKGADVLLDAVARVPDSVWGEDAALMIFGGNLEFQPEPFREKIAALVARAGPRVRMCGAYQNAEMPSLINSVDWMIMPSIWWENSPIVIQEAFFHGRPLICSNIGGMAEKITDGVNGLHFRVGSPEDLADRMAQAMSTPDLVGPPARWPPRRPRRGRLRHGASRTLRQAHRKQEQHRPRRPQYPNSLGKGRTTQWLASW